MKLLIVILNDPDAENVLRGLIEKDYRATRISSTGGFLRRGNTTLLIGLQDDQVDPALEVVRNLSQEPEEPGLRRATVFVLNVVRFAQV